MRGRLNARSDSARSYLIGILALAGLYYLYTSVSTSSFRGATVDIDTVLQLSPEGHADKDFTSTYNDVGSDNLVFVGHKPNTLRIDSESVLDTSTGEYFTDIVTYGEGVLPFNMALLRLPPGSAWGFVGVARGPRRERSGTKVFGHTAYQSVLIAFGLNITSDGKLFRVSEPHSLDYKMYFKEACKIIGIYVSYYGAGDPRLFWTDAGTPGLTFGRFSDHLDVCQGIGYTHDLRDLYPPLAKALLPGHGARPWSLANRIPGENADREMYRARGQGVMEKNWMTMFPGALPNRTLLEPWIHYTVSPKMALKPVSAGPREILFDEVPLSSEAKTANDRCLADNHPTYPLHKYHQATPWYRVTLCARGACTPSESNTVYFSLIHATGNSRYRKVVATYSVIEPFPLISVGPFFNFMNLDDATSQIYAMSMTPVEPADLDASLPRIKVEADINPDHFFFDDEVIVAFGRWDKEIVTSRVAVSELLARQRMCPP